MQRDQLFTMSDHLSPSFPLRRFTTYVCMVKLEKQPEWQDLQTNGWNILYKIYLTWGKLCVNGVWRHNRSKWNKLITFLPRQIAIFNQFVRHQFKQFLWKRKCRDWPYYSTIVQDIWILGTSKLGNGCGGGGIWARVEHPKGLNFHYDKSVCEIFLTKLSVSVFFKLFILVYNCL